MSHLFRLIICQTLFAFFSCKYDTQRSGSDSNVVSTGFYFLICTDPMAHSYHRDFSNTGSYCIGLKRCLKRGYKVIRLPDIEAKSNRDDPCDFCYDKKY